MKLGENKNKNKNLRDIVRDSRMWIIYSCRLNKRFSSKSPENQKDRQAPNEDRSAQRLKRYDSHNKDGNNSPYINNVKNEMHDIFCVVNSYRVNYKCKQNSDFGLMYCIHLCSNVFRKRHQYSSSPLKLAVQNWLSSLGC